jgi:elongation factor Ts
MISNEDIKRLRKETGVGIMDCKRALEQSKGDFEKAKVILREQGKELFGGGKATTEGRIESYIHHSGKVGVLVEVGCETDFTANSQDFKEFVKNLAMHIAAAAPLYIEPEDVPEEVIEREKEIYKKQAQREGKPEHIIERIVEGRVRHYFEEICLLKQDYVKDPKLKVEDLLGELASKVNEKVAIKRFARFQVGRDEL